MIASDTLYGNEGQKIPRDQHDRTISTLNQKGYQVVFDGFTNGGDKVYSDDSQKFIVNLKHFKQTYLPGKTIRRQVKMMTRTSLKKSNRLSSMLVHQHHCLITYKQSSLPVRVQ
ncbi:hypothetical protein SDC49_07870 [Lactobacillus sp. R2/2]|nr:hypothetical protein [Lactobacillus sp. R2/2]